MGDAAATSSAFTFASYDPVAAASIARELAIPGPMASALARRGIETAAAAREFLAADTEHDPLEFPDMAAALARIRAAIAAGERITVHGDYDADGVCATAILIEALRGTGTGAECDWFIPSRLDDGYGLDDSLPARLAERGTGLLITVDCGIVSAPLIAELEAAGIGAIVTDHHRPPDRLPDCPILHPALGYPFAGLCGAAVAAKLAEALTGKRRGLELAALATIADSVPLVDENRRIVREGLAMASKAPRPGLRALMAIASVEPETIEARDVAFRIAPRINAAGRLYRADAGVELLLSDSGERAAEIATELDRANSERRAIESEVVSEAQRQAAQQLAGGEVSALVLAGEGWHPGVVGIAASRMVDRHGVPVLMIAIGPDGIGTGSGRSVAGVDLLAALGECAALLNRFGGRTAAAGLEIDAGRIDELRAAFAEAVADQLAGAEPVVHSPLDGVLGVAELDLELARGLERLGPFGQANPEPRFLISAAVAEDVRPMGEEERHARLMLRSGPHRAAAVAFGIGEQAASWAETNLDAVIRLQVNAWNGSVSARAVLDSATVCPPPKPSGCCAPAAERAAEYLGLVAERLETIATPPEAIPRAIGARRPDRPTLPALGELVTSGRSLAVITADAWRRSSLASRLGALAAGEPIVICSRCAGPLPSLVEAPLITDWVTLGGAGHPIEAEIVAIIDPAPGELISSAALSTFAPGADVFELWGAGEAAFALDCFRGEWDTRAHAAAIYRALSGLEEVAEAGSLATALAGEGPISRTPAAAARALRVLADVGLVERVRRPGSGGALEVRVVSSTRTDLDRSEAYRRFRADHLAGETFLSQQQRRAA